MCDITRLQHYVLDVTLRVDRSLLSTEINHCVLASAVSLHEPVIHLCDLALGLCDESHALDVPVAHFLKGSGTMLLLPPGKLGENSTACSSSLLGLCNIDGNTKQIRRELSDGLVGR